MNKSFKILTIFLQIPEYIEFCIPELKSLFSGYQIPLKEFFKYEISPEKFPSEPYKITRKDFKNFPYVCISIPDPIILKEIFNRSILIVGFLELISEGSSYPEVLENINQTEMEPYVKSKEPFAFYVETHQISITFDNNEIFYISNISIFQRKSFFHIFYYFFLYEM